MCLTELIRLLKSIWFQQLNMAAALLCLGVISCAAAAAATGKIVRSGDPESDQDFLHESVLHSIRELGLNRG